MNFKDVFLAGRPVNYYKNFVLFAPILFSLNIFDFSLFPVVFFGFIIFCVVTSGVYLVNDVFDVERDRKHPVKKNRPIASGRVSLRFAVFLALFYLAVGFASSLILSPDFFLVVLVYVSVNFAYSLFLKRVVIIDVLVVSFGFLLRAYAGLVLAALPFSEWFVLGVYFVSVFLVVQKRKAELLGHGFSSRSVIKKYSLEFLNQLSSVFMSLIILAYSFYTFQKAPSHLMIITIPNVIYALFRYSYLTEKYGFGENTQDIIRDLPSVLNVFIYVVLTAGIFLLA